MLKGNMEKRIELESRGREPEEITEFNLDNCRATQIEGLTDKYVNLQSVSLINVGLLTLKKFPSLPNLKRLELSDNRISDSLQSLKDCPKLQYINLSGNKIKDIETLTPLKEHCPELKTLDLFNCEVTNVENYREKVFELLTDLEFLDGFDKMGGEADDPDDNDDVDGDDDVDVSSDEDDEEGLGDEDDDSEGDEDDDGLVDEDDDGEDDDEVGLEYLEKEDLSDDEDDFDPEGGPVEDGEEEEGDVEQSEEEGEARGVKRKLSDEDA